MSHLLRKLCKITAPRSPNNRCILTSPKAHFDWWKSEMPHDGSFDRYKYILGVIFTTFLVYKEHNWATYTKTRLYIV